MTMATIKGNKEVLQSYIITTAKYDFSIYEKRILYRQIEIEQELLLGNKITPNIKIETNLWRDKKYTIPVRALLTNGEDKNHARIKKAFEDLMNKKIIYETKDEIEGFPLVQYFHIDKKGETVTPRGSDHDDIRFLNFHIVRRHFLHQSLVMVIDSYRKVTLSRILTDHILIKECF